MTVMQIQLIIIWKNINFTIIINCLNIFVSTYFFAYLSSYILMNHVYINFNVLNVSNIYIRIFFKLFAMKWENLTKDYVHEYGHEI